MAKRGPITTHWPSDPFLPLPGHYDATNAVSFGSFLHLRKIGWRQKTPSSSRKCILSILSTAVEFTKLKLTFVSRSRTNTKSGKSRLFLIFSMRWMNSLQLPSTSPCSSRSCLCFSRDSTASRHRRWLIPIGSTSQQRSSPTEQKAEKGQCALGCAQIIWPGWKREIKSTASSEGGWIIE